MELESRWTARRALLQAGLAAVAGGDQIRAAELAQGIPEDERSWEWRYHDGGTVAIANYAPALVFNTKTLPLPRNEKARAYGVQPERLWKP